MNSLEDHVDLPLLSHELANEKFHPRSDTPPPNLNKRRPLATPKLDPLPPQDSPAIRRRKQFYTIFVTSLISSVITVFILAGLWTSMYDQDISAIVTKKHFVYDEFYSVESPSQTGCGTTVEEAKALNCRFDELSDLWLPQKCSRKYEEEYLKKREIESLKYWTKRGSEVGNIEVTNRSEWAGGATYYSTTRDHLRHCEYNFYRFADSLMSGEAVGHSEGYGPHMHHCAQILGRFANLAPNIDNIDVDTVSTFGFC